MKAFVAALAAVIGLSACTPPAPIESSRTIAEQLLSDSATDNAQGFDTNYYDFDVVTQLVLDFPDLVAAASDPEASLTAFLPNDRAFQVLVFDLTGQLLDDEGAITAAVKSLGADTVKTVLTYHLVGAKIPASAALASNGGSLDSLQGGKIGVYVASEALSLVFLQDKDPNSPDPATVFSKYNYGGALSNGYIHGITAVLRPADL